MQPIKTSNLIRNQRANRSISFGHTRGRSAKLTVLRIAPIGSLILLASMLMVAFFSFCVLSDILTPAKANAEVATIIGPGGYTLSVASSAAATDDTVSINVTPTASGSLKMSEEILTTSTTATSGYSLYIGMSGSSNNLYLNGDTSSTALSATNSSYTYASPNVLDTNSWGYAVPQSYNSGGSAGTQTPGTDVATGNGFDTGTYIDGGTDTGTKWAAVPVKGSEQLLQSTSEATNGKELHIFYGSKANNVQAAGIYKGTVVYTAVASASEGSMVSVSPSTLNGLAGGGTLTINLGVNTTYSADFLNSTINVGTQPCTPNGGGNATGELYLTCTAPAQTNSGRYDVVITLSDGSNSYGTYTAVNGVEYLNNKDNPNAFFELANLQDMTSDICDSVETPEMVLDTASSTVATDRLATSLAQYNAIGPGKAIPQITLTDTRDNQTYRIRKLADGNCWMTENLRYGINPDGTTHAWTVNDVMLSDGVDNIEMATALINSTVDTYTNLYDQPVMFVGDAQLVDGGENGSVITYWDTWDNSGASLGASNTSTQSADNRGRIDGFQAAGSKTGSEQKLGVYYNYCAASGGTNCEPKTEIGTTTGSICPKGWTLPTYDNTSTGSGGTTTGAVKSYKNLLNVYGIGNKSDNYAKVIATPLSFIRTGYAAGTKLYHRAPSGSGSSGYWSFSPSATAGQAYFFGFTSSVYLANAYRHVGRSVRCVAR